MKVVYRRDKIDKGKEISVRVMKHASNDFHAHNFMELACILDGSATHVVGDEETRLTRGDIVLIDLGVEHCYRTENNEKIEICNCLFPPEIMTEAITDENLVNTAYDLFLSDRDEKFGAGYVTLTGQNALGIMDYLMEMASEQKNGEDGWQKAIKAMLKIVLIKILRAQKSSKKKDCEQTSEKRKLVSDIIENIILLDGKDLSVETLSKEMFFSPAYLSRLFKQHTGRSLVGYIQQRKMQSACKLMKESDLSIEKIMDTVGYSDKKHFYDVFLATYGVTPGEYRSKNKIENYQEKV